MKKSLFSAEAVYKPYEYKGLHGRYAHIPAASSSAKRTFVVVYGQHATLERVRPIADALSSYGDVYMVDTPGFGGMDPSYKIEEPPTLGFMAAHLHHFIEEHIPAERQLTFLGISYGFQIVTMALAGYPELARRTEQAVSFAGFVKHTDFSMPLSYRLVLIELMARPSKHRPGAAILKTIMQPSLLKGMYVLNRPFNVKFKSLPKDERRKYVNEQIWLWMVNDHRTHGATAWDFVKKTDLTALRPPVDVIHVGVPNDHLLNNAAVVAELRSMYRSTTVYDLNLPNHAPLDVNSADKVQSILPAGLVETFKRSKNSQAVTKEKS